MVEATTGTLTIDPGSIDNTALLEANGGALTIDATPVTNSGTLLATDASTLTLSADTMTNTGGTVEVDAGSLLDFAGSSVNGGAVDVYGTLDSTGYELDQRRQHPQYRHAGSEQWNADHRSQLDRQYRLCSRPMAVL